MALQSPLSVVSVIPVSRERRARRHRLAAVLVIAAVASSATILQAFHDRDRNTYPGQPAAFSYFPN